MFLLPMPPSTPPRPPYCLPAPLPPCLPSALHASLPPSSSFCLPHSAVPVMLCLPSPCTREGNWPVPSRLHWLKNVFGILAFAASVQEGSHLRSPLSLPPPSPKKLRRQSTSSGSTWAQTLVDDGSQSGRELVRIHQDLGPEWTCSAARPGGKAEGAGLLRRRRGFSAEKLSVASEKA